MQFGGRRWRVVRFVPFRTRVGRGVLAGAAAFFEEAPSRDVPSAARFFSQPLVGGD